MIGRGWRKELPLLLEWRGRDLEITIGHALTHFHDSSRTTTLKKEVG